MFGTKGVKSEDSSGVARPYLNHGINHARIVGISVRKAASTDSRQVIFQFEGDPVKSSEFKGVDGARGPVGRVSSRWMGSDKEYAIFMSQIGTIADKLKVRGLVDGIQEASIEAYVAKLSPILAGKYAWWNFGAREYEKGKFGLQMLRFGFVKSEAEIDSSTLVKTKWINTEVRDTNGKVAMKFDEGDKYQYEAYKEDDFSKSSSGPLSAEDFMKTEQASTTFDLPDSFSNPVPRSVDDLPFN